MIGKSNRILILSIGCASFAMLLAVRDVSAQPAVGTDAFIAAMQDLNLFSAHRNHCDSMTEAFVVVHSAVHDVGFCVEKSERASASFEAALKDCLDDGKRLPEPTEFKVACNNAGALGISDMTDGDYEWASNFVRDAYTSSIGSGQVVPALGGSACTHGTHRALSFNAPYNPGTTAPYRCVH